MKPGKIETPSNISMSIRLLSSRTLFAVGRVIGLSNAIDNNKINLSRILEL